MDWKIGEKWSRKIVKMEPKNVKILKFYAYNPVHQYGGRVDWTPNYLYTIYVLDKFSKVLSKFPKTPQALHYRKFTSIL